MHTTGMTSSSRWSIRSDAPCTACTASSGLKNEIPTIYHGIADPKVAIAGVRTLMG